MTNLGPAPEGFRWIGQFQMSNTGNWSGKTTLDDIVSVDVHPSGLWAVVDMGDTLAWLRIPADVITVEWQHQHELREIVGFERLPKRRSKILKAGAAVRSGHEPGLFERLWQIWRKRGKR